MMSEIPQPRVGMVVNFEYLWARQYKKGWTDGEKIRPCAVLAVVEGKDETTVYVSPITHTPPFHPEESIQLSPQTSLRLGLDRPGRECVRWLMVNEVNKFIWPGGGHLCPVGHQSPPKYCFGMMPEAVLLEARTKLRDFSQNKELLYVPRDDRQPSQRTRVMAMNR